MAVYYPCVVALCACMSGSFNAFSRFAQASLPRFVVRAIWWRFFFFLSPSSQQATGYELWVPTQSHVASVTKYEHHRLTPEDNMKAMTGGAELVPHTYICGCNEYMQRCPTTICVNIFILFCSISNVPKTMIGVAGLVANETHRAYCNPNWSSNGNVTPVSLPTD